MKSSRKSGARQAPRASKELRNWLLLGTAIASLVACGGGGTGGGSGNTDTSGTTSQPTETPGSTGGGTVDTPVVIEALPTGTRALNLVVDEHMMEPGNLLSLTGGGLQTGWNPKDPRTGLAPGMKVAFYGRANGCTATAANGPVTNGTDADFAAASSLTNLSTAAVASTTRWMPLGASASCDASTQTRSGPNQVFINASAQDGAIGLYTPIGPQTDGEPPFFSAFDSGGVDGSGYNANGLSTFVGFRQAWNAADAIRPWVHSQTGLSGNARVVSRQSIGSLETGSGNGQTVQLKQQIIVSLINTTCKKEGVSVSGPCQIQYLFNTAIARAGVTDWESYQPAQTGRVWYDKVQGSMPIVAGLVPAAGKSVTDSSSGLPLYSSAGATSQHGTFKQLDFDLRISFEELKNAARIIAAAKLDASATNLSEADMQLVWGSQWDDPTRWTLVASMVGQESYSTAFKSQRAWIGGGFSSLYVGPAQ
jgi:hypothetical protein